MHDRRPLSSALTLAALGLGLFAGCDNPTCVFVDGCRDGNGGNDPGGLGNAGATFPEDGAFLAAGPPRLLAVAPQLQDLHPRSPLFLEFSESLDPASLDGAFRVIDLVLQQEIPVAPAQVVGNGRVVVIVPLTGYQPNRQYQVLYGEEQEIRDLNGEELGPTGLDSLLDFAVVEASTIPTPRLLYAYPPDLSINAGDASEIVIGFDRRMETATFDDDTFDVIVDGVAPVVDPAPTALQLGVGQIGLGQTQVWLWTPVDGSGRAVALGANARVQVRLSQGIGEITSEGGDPLPDSETEFQTLDFSLPATVQKAAGAGAPDAFGRADVFGGAPIVEVTLEQPAPSGLSADLFLFGTSPQNQELLKSIVANVPVPAGATTLSLTSADLELFDAAGNVQFADGEFECAVQLRRTTASTGIRRFDADPMTPDFERPFFDTVPPVLLGLGATGAVTSSFVGDVRDFAAVGRASEPIAFAFVDAGVNGTNGGTLADPPETAFSAAVPGTGEALFVCAPVAVGALDPAGGGSPYDITIYDRARNAATLTAVGTFFQRGVVGPGGAPAGATVDVRVYDQRSLRAVPNALVFSHRESGGAVTFVDSATTNGNGLAQLSGAASANTVITVDVPGYDLFTFHGIPRDSLEILLTVSNLGVGTVEGTVSSVFPTGNFSGATTTVAETRAPRLKRLDNVATCSPNSTATRYECDFGPVIIGSSVLGGATFLATQDNLPQVSFNPIAYLRGFALTAPLGPVGAGGAAMNVELDAGDQLALSPPGVQSVAITPHLLDSSAAMNLGMLGGDPLLTVEAVAAGLRGPLIVGRANPYPLGGTTWTALGAVAGIAGPGGALELRGAIQPDLHLRAALTDMAGNEVAARPRLSTSMGMLNPIDVPRFLAPGPGGMTGGDAYNIVVEDTLPDSAGGDGFVRVVVTGPGGRRWILWGLDTSDAAGNLLLSVPDIAAQGGTPLPDGAQTAEVTLWGGPFDRGRFLWSDIEREHELFGRAAPVAFTQD